MAKYISQNKTNMNMTKYRIKLQKILLTLTLTDLTTLWTFASQKAPLYLADTSVPTVRKGGSSGCR